MIDKLEVLTQHSRYVIDQESGTVARTPIHEKASDLSPYLPNGEPKHYDKIASSLEPGDPLVIVYSDGTYSVSTPIESVNPLTGAA